MIYQFLFCEIGIFDICLIIYFERVQYRNTQVSREYNKVSVQGNVALGGHFATLCREVDFYKAIFFFIINFQKEKANTFTILIVKSLQIELHSTNLTE